MRYVEQFLLKFKSLHRRGNSTSAHYLQSGLIEMVQIYKASCWFYFMKIRGLPLGSTCSCAVPEICRRGTVYSMKPTRKFSSALSIDISKLYSEFLWWQSTRCGMWLPWKGLSDQPIWSLFVNGLVYRIENCFVVDV